MFCDLLKIKHADLAVVTDSYGKTISQTIYMFENPENKKVLKEFIDTKELIPLVKFNNNCEMCYYKIIITEEEFKLLN